MLDLLESKEESGKIEAPQFNEEDRELPNYWILLKFHAAFHLEAQQAIANTALPVNSVINVGSNTPTACLLAPTLTRTAPQSQTTVSQQKFTNLTVLIQIY